MTKSNCTPVHLMLLLFASLLLIGGCSTSPPARIQTYTYNKPAVIHAEVVDVARAMLGIPYHYGGDTPREGFDCSGLVYYAHERAGVRLPRTSYGQYRASIPVSIRKLRPGDLVFFRLHRYKISHVGIYIGHHEFIHAPSRGKEVMIESLTDPYWREHFVRGGRIL